MKKHLLIITLNWPAPHFSAAGVRLFQLIDFFSSKGFAITIACTAEEPVEPIPEMENLSWVKIRVNHSSFDDFVRELNPKVVLFDRFTAEEQFGWRVAHCTPDALRILDTEDLHSLRSSREEALKSNRDFTIKQWLQNDRTKREVASIYRSDLSLIISSYEMELLEAVIQVPKHILLHLPFMVDPIDQAIIDQWPPFDARSDFMFMGFGGHAPNINAIKELKTTIWPLVRKQLPKVKLRIYGAQLPKHIHQMHNTHEGFLVEGWAKDVKEVMQQAKVVLAPLRFGAGLKGKLLDAMQYGTPSVTTTIGAEGMHGGLPWNGHIANDPTVFAQSAVDLYSEAETWQQAQGYGVEIIHTQNKKSDGYKKLDATLNGIEQDLPDHRHQNFFGSLLQYHTLASTKYMAKWIEEKNRKP